MVTENQTEVIDWIASRSTHGGAEVERIDTHTAIVVLAGSRAFKLKRAVRFDYVNFSTTERRRAMCQAEVELNRRTAPGLYRGVVAVTRESDGSLALNGSGPPVDWLVEMNRFDPEGLLDRVAARGALSREVMDRLATSVAHFHSGAIRRGDHGGSAAVRWVIDGNAAGLSEFGGAFLDRPTCARLQEAALREHARYAALLDARQQAGWVRQCHGDLHLRNIVLLEGMPTLFDAIEFNDELACIDVFYDLSFLLMDLWRRGLRVHANLVLNRYLAETGDIDGVALLPLFLSCRAAIRAKTNATAASMQTDADRVNELRRNSREYLSLAVALLQPAPPALIAVGGRSGSGKSTLALAIAPEVGAVPGAVVLRSDEIRKELSGARRLQRLPMVAYAAEMSASVYDALRARATMLLQTGHGVIVDAVYARERDREALEEVARRAAVPFKGLWLEAPTSVLLERVRRRRQDPSDADARVVLTQSADDVGHLCWERLDAAGTPEALQRDALAVCPRRELCRPICEGSSSTLGCAAARSTDHRERERRRPCGCPDDARGVRGVGGDRSVVPELH
jgi:uncharacterized protein